MTNSDRLGKEQERTIVRWARCNGFAHADRVVRTGAGRGYGHRADEGDVWLCPGVIAQSKRLAPVNRMERAVPVWLEQTEAQRVAADADVGLLIVRREGCADVGQWWCFLPLDDCLKLCQVGEIVRRGVDRGIPARLQVGDTARLLRAYGYGDPLDSQEGIA